MEKEKRIDARSASVLEDCFRKWARLSVPNGNLSDAFVKKARNDLIVLRSIPDTDKEWRATTAYYARYHMITAMLQKIGIDCKDHNCSIRIAEQVFSGMISERMLSDLKTAKKHRINLQYYTDRPVDENEFEKNMKNVNIFVDDMLKILESLTREKIEALRKKPLAYQKNAGKNETPMWRALQKKKQNKTTKERQNRGSLGSLAYAKLPLLLTIAFAIMLFLIVPAHAKQTNVTALYGYNGSAFVEIQATAAGELKTNLLLNETSGIIPLTNNTYDMGSATLAWNRLYARSVRSTGPALSLFAGGSERLTVTAGGLVGIGIASPQQTLEVVGTINATGRAFLNGSAVIRGIAYTFPSADGAVNQVLTTNSAGVLSWASVSGTNLSGGGATNYIVKWQNTTHLTNSILYDDGTNVGIGTASPVEKLDVRGNINASGAVNATKFIGEGTVPAGTVSFYNGTTCPTGWVNFTDARGRVIVGLPVGGTLGGTAGSALTDNGTRTITDNPAHTHSADPPSTTSSSDGSHTHSADPPSTASDSQGSHTHSVDPPSTASGAGSSHTHSVDPLATSVPSGGSHDHTFGIRSDASESGNDNLFGGNDHTPETSSAGSHSHTFDVASFTSAAETAHTHSTDIASFTTGSGGGHTHTTDIASFTSSSDGAHTHSTDIASFTSGSTGSASVDVTLPYVQMLPCIKT